MKNLLTLLLLCLTIWLISCGGDENPVVESPIPNTDSIRCAQKWQQFQLPNDTILTLRYQQPVKIGNGSDTIAVTVTRIDDFCTEESEGTIYGCEAKVWVDLVLNNQCIYKTKYGLRITRRSANPTFQNFNNLSCSSYPNNFINDNPSGLLGFYNTVVHLNRLTPFAKNLPEFNDLTANKQKYTVTIWLKKRCF